jgi:triosephosphate isomerase
MRAPILVANWKMHKTLAEGISLVEKLITCLEHEPKKNSTIILCPSFIHLYAIHQLIQQTSLDTLAIGAQNCHHEPTGAFTGEVSATMLSSVGARYVLIGHSERRQYFGENASMLAKKVGHALSTQIQPIFCCGEDLQTREHGQQVALVTQQILEGLTHLTPAEISRVIIAYEPIWAIGSGKIPSLADIETIHGAIRASLAARYGAHIASKVPILYGGSCNAQNTPRLLASAYIDGLLVGGASLEFNSFWPIIQAI